MSTQIKMIVLATEELSRIACEQAGSKEAAILEYIMLCDIRMAACHSKEDFENTALYYDKAWVELQKLGYSPTDKTVKEK